MTNRRDRGRPGYWHWWTQARGAVGNPAVDVVDLILTVQPYHAGRQAVFQVVLPWSSFDQFPSWWHVRERDFTEQFASPDLFAVTFIRPTRSIGPIAQLPAWTYTGADAYKRRPRRRLHRRRRLYVELRPAPRSTLGKSTTPALKPCGPCARPSTNSASLGM